MFQQQTYSGSSCLFLILFKSSAGYVQLIFSLQPQRVTSIYLYPTLSTLNHKHQPKKLLIVKQILPVSTLRNVQRTVWRICILMLGCKGLTLKGLDHAFTCCIVTCFQYVIFHLMLYLLFQAFREGLAYHLDKFKYSNASTGNYVLHIFFVYNFFSVQIC